MSIYRTMGIHRDYEILLCGCLQLLPVITECIALSPPCCAATVVKKPAGGWEGCLLWGGHTAFWLVKAHLSMMVCCDNV